MNILRHLILLSAVVLSCFGAMAQDNDSAKTINKKNLVVKEWNISPRNGSRTLDHVTIFSPEGRKIEETEYDSTGKQKWRKRYEWGENERMTRELLYDERNRLVNYKKYEYNEFGKKKTQYTYDPKGKLVSTKTFEYITQDA